MEDLVVKEVNFNGDELLAAKDIKTGKIYVGVSWVCNGLGFEKRLKDRQVENIQKDIVLSKGCTKFGAGVFDKYNETLAIELEFLPLWLAKISITPTMQANSPEVVEKIVAYQLKVKDVLAEAFIPQTLESALPLEIQFMQKTLETITNMHLELQGVKGKIDTLEDKTTEVTNRFDDVKIVFTQKDENWRQYITDSVNQIVKKSGRSFAEVRNETYDRLRSTTSCNLKTRLEHTKERMYQQGIPHSKVSSINNMDVIENDNKLKTALTYIAKEMVVAYA